LQFLRFTMPRSRHPLEIHKFGGASLANGVAIAHAVSVIRARRPAPLVVVVSAMAGVTDALLDLAGAAVRGDADGARATLDRLAAQHRAAVAALVRPGPRSDELLQAIEGGRCAKRTMVIVTYDEFGGQWDHVSPPGQGGTPGPHDQWGPGTRVPARLVSPWLHGPFVVDHAQHDTTSILATIEHRFGLAPLTTRDAAVADLSSVFFPRPSFGWGHERHHHR